MMTLSRWFAPAVLAVGLGVAGLTPSPARADDNLVRVIVDIADVIVRGGVPYDRRGEYGYNDPLVVVRDRYQRPTYYRYAPQRVVEDHWHHGRGRGHRQCDSHGHQRVVYYNPRHDRYGRRGDWARRGHSDRYDQHEGDDRQDRYYQQRDSRDLYSRGD